MKTKTGYKWSRLLASKRFDTKDGVIKLTPLEQQELLDDIESINNLKEKFFEECVTCGEVDYEPHDLFEWFKRNI